MSAAKKSSEKVEEAVEAAEDAAEETAEAAEAAVEEAGARGRDRLDEIVHALQELGKVAGRAGDSLRTNIRQAPDVVRDGVAQTEERVRERPLASLGVAAGVGLLLGLLLNRRN